MCVFPLRSGYSYKVAVALSLFLGWLGADRFYLGYPALGNYDDEDEDDGEVGR